MNDREKGMIRSLCFTGAFLAEEIEGNAPRIRATLRSQGTTQAIAEEAGVDEEHIESIWGGEEL